MLTDGGADMTGPECFLFCKYPEMQRHTVNTFTFITCKIPVKDNFAIFWVFEAPVGTEKEQKMTFLPIIINLVSKKN